MTQTSKQANTSYKIISITALVWNLFGVLSYLGQVYMTDDMRALLPEDQQSYYTHLPSWVTGVFALAVFTGAIGALALVLKKKWASPFLIVSLISVLAQAYYNFFMQKDMALSGGSMLMPLTIIAVSIYLVWFAKTSKDNGILT